MFVINNDKSIYATRGDIVFLSVSATDNGEKYIFKPGDVVKINVFGKKNTKDVVLEDAVTVAAETEEVEIFLNGRQTKFGEPISKPKDYWYEIVLNPETNPQTIVGYDEEGPKIFRIYPEGNVDDISTEVEDYEHLAGIKRNIQGEFDVLDLLHGSSAYEIALLNGFEGTEQEWLDSLKYVPTEEDKAEMLEQVSEKVQDRENERQATFEINESARQTAFETAEASRVTAENLRVEAENKRNEAYEVAESERDNAYQNAESERDNAFSEFLTENQVNIEGKEDKSNKVIQLVPTATDDQYPSAKAVLDYVDPNFKILTNSLTSLSKSAERVENKATAIDENSTDEQYPSALAVLNLVKSFGHIKTITENTSVCDLDDGVYVIECVPTSDDTDYFLTVPATAEGEEIPALANGMALVSRSSMADGVEPTIHWLFMGLGDDGVQSIRIGSMQWDDADSQWYSYDSGEFEFASNKVNEITEENKPYEWLYPSVPAVEKYVSQMVEENKIKTITEPCHIAELEPGFYVVKNAFSGEEYTGKVIFANVTNDNTINDSYFTLESGLLMVLNNIVQVDGEYEQATVGYVVQGIMNIPNISYESDSFYAQHTIQNSQTVTCLMGEAIKTSEAVDGYEANKWYSPMPNATFSDIPASAVKKDISESSTHFDVPSAKAVFDYVNEFDGGSDYTLPVGGEELGGVKNGGNVVINEDGTMTAPESEVTDEQISSAVSDWIEANPDKATTVQDGSITQEKLSDELVTKLGLEPNHHLTEVKLTLQRGEYNQFWDGVATGTSTSTELFETPQYIKIVNNHSCDIAAKGVRFADILDYENANFITDLNSQLLHQFGYLKDTIPMGEEMIFPTFEWGSKSRKYIQLYFQPSVWNNAWNNIEIYAIYDSWKPSYKNIPNDEESKEIFLEDLPMKWVVSDGGGATYCGVYCAVPYYPDFTYHIRGGYYATTLINSLHVYGIYDDISVFDTPQKCIIGMNGYVSNINAFPLSKFYGNTTQYDTSVNGGANANYKWAYFKTPAEEELTGLKWLLIQFSSEIGSDGAYVKGYDITEEYVNYVLENSSLFNGKLQYQYISRWQDKDAPRKHTTILRKVNPNLNDDGTIYQTFNTLNEYSPLSNSKWVLFGDSLTDSYGGHDKSSEYFASKIANEFNMNLDNRAKSGSNIYAGGSGNYVSVSGIVMLDAYLAEIEAGTTEQADYITVAFGTNTFKTEIGTNDDTSETNTSVYGATKYFIEKIREKVPNAVLGFVLSPRQDWGNNDAQNLRDLNGAREAIKTVCDEYGVPYIDMSTQSGITVNMLPDGIHISSEQSQKLYYHAMRRFMMGL